MTPEQFQLARDLFLAACDAAPDGRTRLLDERCDDEEIRAAVESWLAEDGVPQPLDDELDVSSAVAELTADAKPPKGQPPALPPRIGQFTILDRLGEGGMGVVYRARQDSPRREVAVKLMRRQLMTRGTRRRFEQEAEILGRLQHPGIAQIYDAGTFDLGEGGQPYFAMELVRGAPLTKYAREHDLGTRQRLELFAQICDAVEHAHLKSVIHRDLKPDNILVQEDGAPKVLDFGIARATDSDMQVTTLHTDVGQVIGTVPYMSPEQVAGDVRDLDTRTDVYALGVVLYELLSGRLPHDLKHRSIPEAARIIRDEEHTRLSSISTSFRGDVDTIVAKALAKEPDRRYPSAAALAADIRRHLTDQPIVARPTSTFYQLRKFVRRNRGLSAGVAAAILVLIIGFVVSTSLYIEAEQRRRAADWQSYLANVTAAAVSLEVHNLGDARRRLERARPDLRGWEWRHWNLVRDLSLDHVEHETGISSVAISADGRRVVTVTSDRTCRVWDAQTWTLIDEIGPVPNPSVAISADGEQVIAGGRLLWRPGSGLEPTRLEPEVTVEDFERDARGTRVYADVPVAASPDGRRIVSGTGDATARIWDTDRKETVHVLQAGAGVTAVAYSPDANRVATGDDDGRIVVWDAAAGARLVELDGHEERITTLAFHPDSIRLVSGSLDNTVGVWDAEAGHLLSTIGGHEDFVSVVSVHPDGRRILSGGGDSALRVWDIDTGSASIAVRHSGALVQVAFSPDGTRVISCDGRQTDIRDAATGAPVVAIGTPYARAFVILNDRLVTAANSLHSTQNRVNVWSLETGAKLATYTIRASALAGHPDGTSIVAGGNGGGTMIDPATGSQRAMAYDGYGHALGISVDGRLLLTGARSPQGALLLFSLRSEKSETLDGHSDRITDIAIHPDGRHAVTASHDRTMRVWDLEARRCVTVLRGHDGGVASVAVSPDGRRIVSGSADRTVRLWDFTRGDQLATLTGHASSVSSVGFSPDGRRIVSGDTSGVMRTWETEIESAQRMWRAAAARRPLETLVESLIDRGLDADAVITALRDDPTLEPAQREPAVRLARARMRPELPIHHWDRLTRAFGMAAQRGRERAHYEEAHRFITSVLETEFPDRPDRRPDRENPAHWNTLGVVLYRLGRYEDALDAFAETERRNADGGYPMYPAEFFGGLIDEVTLFDRALDQTEIQAIYDAGSAGIQSIAVPPGLVSWWTGDVDASDRRGANDGVLTDGAIAGAPGFVRGAFELDGANARIITTELNVNLANLTIAAWINPNDVSGGHQRIVTKYPGTSAPDGHWAFDFLANGALRLGVGGSTRGRQDPSMASPAGTVTSGTWQFVAATYDGTTIRIYRNAALVLSLVVDKGPIPALSQKIVIGEDDAAKERYHVAHYRVWQAQCHYYLGDTQRARACLAEARTAPERVLARIDAFLVEAASVIEAGDPMGP